MRIRALGYNLSLFALVTISVLSLHLTAAAQICSSGVCVTTWQQDTHLPISAPPRTDSSGAILVAS
jgi:hypothetical protein